MALRTWGDWDWRRVFSMILEYSSVSLVNEKKVLNLEINMKAW